MKDKLKTNGLLSPILTMVILIFIVSFLSFIFEMINVEGNITSIVNGRLETSIIVVKNIISKDGLIYILSNLTNNFNLLEQLVLIIIGLFSVSILDASGILKHIFTPLKKIKSRNITFLVVFLGIISAIIQDYSYIILIPLVSIMYKYINKNPILGIITVFIGITLGLGIGMCNFNDYTLGMLTQSAANVDVDPTYTFNLYSNLYIMLTSIILISFIITFLIEKYIIKKIPLFEPEANELKTSKKALIISLLIGIISTGIILIGILPNGILLDNTQNIYVAKLFSDNAPFNLSFMYILLLIFSIVGFIYGYISKNFENNHEFSLGYTKEFNNIGYLFILLFLSSILISIVNWTNLSTVIISQIMNLIELFNFTGIPLIVLTFILIIIMSIIMPNNVEKWILISPILIPIFMRANISPDFTQFLFKTADSIGKCITPLYIYFIITLGFIQKYNNGNRISLFNIIKYTFPILITIIIFWLMILIIWYISGLPLGIGTYATM